MNNQQGNSLFLSLLILMSISFLSLKLINNKLRKIERTRYINQQYLCMKEYNGSTSHFIKHIEVMNNFIILGKAVEYLSTIIPPLRGLIYLAAKYGIMTVKGVQNLSLISYLKKYYDYYQKGCYFSPEYFKTPFKHSFVQFKRSSISQITKRRSKKWTQDLYAYKELFMLRSHMKRKSYSAKVQTQELQIPQNIKLHSIRDYIQWGKKVISDQLF